MKSRLTALLFLLPFLVQTQNLFPDPGQVFRDDVIPRIDIFIAQDSLDALYAPGNEESNYHYTATFVFDNGEILDTLNNVGFRFRGNTSRFSAKKSFKVSFNTYESGRQWYGLEKLNINGEHNDPSVSRAKLAWDLCRDIGIPAPRANHVDLYINNEYWGLYINVEHIDEEFVELRFGNKDGNLYKCLWPADLNYKGPNPDAYKETFGGRRAYALKTNEEEDNYEDIAHFIDVLNNTSDDNLVCELENVFNVDTYLKAIAMDILTANWDGPIFNKNNFYLYHNQATGKFEYIPYDLDNTFGIDWFGEDWASRDIYEWSHSSQNRPIYERLMEEPIYRNRYSYYMNQILEDVYQIEELSQYLDDLKAMISPSAEADPLRPQDYGFSFEVFQNSFEESTPYNHTPIGLKPFIINRWINTNSQLDVQNIHPLVSNVENNYPNESQEIQISATVFDDEDIASVEVCYFLNGNFECAAMFDDGLNGDGEANDGVYGVLLPPTNEQAIVEYQIVATDNEGLMTGNPACGVYNIIIGSSEVPLVINEFMASNNSTISDEFGEFDDWVEIFNPSEESIYLGNYFLSDKQGTPDKWQLPDVWIEPSGYILIWADNDPEQGEFHTNFKLSASGEFIGIFDTADNNFALIDGHSYLNAITDVAIGRLPNGTGDFENLLPTPGAENSTVNNVESKDINDPEILIFPNPASDYITFKLSSIFEKEINIRVFNSIGELVADSRIPSFQVEKTYSIQNLEQGVYYVEFTNGSYSLGQQKIVVVR